MKYFIYVLILLSAGLMVFNFFHLDYDNLFSKDGSPALIGVLASLCVIVLMLILMVSRTIKKKVEVKN